MNVDEGSKQPRSPLPLRNDNVTLSLRERHQTRSASALEQPIIITRMLHPSTLECTTREHSNEQVYADAATAHSLSSVLVRDWTDDDAALHFQGALTQVRV